MHGSAELMAGAAADTAAPSGSLTLERGLRVLRVLADHPAGLSVSDLAREMSTHRAGVYRLLGPLSDQRLVLRGEDGRFRLGIGLIELASGVRARLQEIALPELQALADEVGATDGADGPRRRAGSRRGRARAAQLRHAHRLPHGPAPPAWIRRLRASRSSPRCRPGRGSARRSHRRGSVAGRTPPASCSPARRGWAPRSRTRRGRGEHQHRLDRRARRGRDGRAPGRRRLADRRFAAGQQLAARRRVRLAACGAPHRTIVKASATARERPPALLAVTSAL